MNADMSIVPLAISQDRTTQGDNNEGENESGTSAGESPSSFGRFLI